MKAVSQPTINAVSVNEPQCLGTDDGSITISATGTGTLQYSIDNGSTFQTSNIFTSLFPGTYNIVVTDNNGNTTSSAVLTYEQTVIASFLPSVSTGAAVLDVDFTNVSTGATSYSWNFDGTTSSNSTMVNPSFSYDMPGVYTVTLIAFDNTCSDTTSTTVTVTGTSAILKVPNVFSPNNDGVNDVFKISSVGIDEMQVFIYNRYGEVVYEWYGRNGFWDGHTYPAGQPVPDGTYYFYYKATGYDGLLFEENGIITITR